MNFDFLIQCKNRILLKNILLPIIRGDQLKSFIVLILRILTLNFFFILKESQDNLIYSIKNDSEIFVLDLRESKLDLGGLGVLLQFFKYISEKYKVFEVWIDKNSFSFNQYKNFSKEFEDILDFVSKTIKVKVLKKKKNNKYQKNSSYLKISYTQGYKINGKTFRDPEVIYDFFIKELKFVSKPINFSIKENLNNNIENKVLLSLKKVLEENFIIIFYPTFDLFLKREKKGREFGVISEENFKYMEEVYLNILNEIKRKKIDKIKIVLFNKKSFNWPINEHCIDLRYFEDYNMNFPQVFGILNDNCNWTIGSEGTISYYLVLCCSNLKHVLFVDNSHWKNLKNSHGSVPIFYSERKDISYKNKPLQYIPKSKDEILNKIFEDYEKFIINDKNNKNNLS